MSEAAVAASAVEQLPQNAFQFPERRWIPTQYYRNNPRRSEPGTELTFLSYNLLAQDLLEQHRYLYLKSDNQYLNWEHRWQMMSNELRQLSPDIIALQEVQATHLREYIEPFFTSLGYQVIYKQKTGTAASDGCALVFNKKMFRLIESRPVEFYRPGVETLDRHNIGLVALLEPTKPPMRSSHYRYQSDATYNPRRLCVATTHLLFNSKRGDVKLAQLVLLLAEVERMAFCGFKQPTRNSTSPRIPRYCPIILAGDFNARPKCPLYEFVTSGYLRYADMPASYVGDSRAVGLGGRRMPCCGIVPSSQGITNRCQYVSELSRREDGQRPSTPSWKPESVNQNPGFTTAALPQASSVPAFNVAVNDNVPVTDSNTCSNSPQPVNWNCVPTPMAFPNYTYPTAGYLHEQQPSFVLPNCRAAFHGVPYVGYGFPPGYLTPFQQQMMLNRSHWCQDDGSLSHSFPLLSVYKHSKDRTNERSDTEEVTSCHSHDSSTVDYVFYSIASRPNEVHNAKEGPLRLMMRYSLYRRGDLNFFKGFPNKHYGSDHICLGAKFFWRENWV